MKIGIITFHFASNQGAVLQCYALQTYLEKQGHMVEVIDYRPAYHLAKYTPHKNPFIIAKSNWKRNSKMRAPKRVYIYIRGFARGVISSIEQADRVRFALFESFRDEHLHQSERYTTLKQLQNKPPCDDLYIAGSDQIWNTDFCDYELDPAYFLKFGNLGTKRVTYAVSPKEKYSNTEKEQLKELCRGLDYISIREPNPDITQVVERDVEIDPDPTLLIDKEDYNVIEAERIVREPYLFVYGMEDASEVDSAVKTISETKGLKVVNGSPHRIRLSMECEKVYDYGPKEFLSYIKYASYVVTNSFHGTVFSVLYEKPFTSVTHSTRGKRITSLLSAIELDSRLWDETTSSWNSGIDYESVRRKIELLRNNADNYFKKVTEA